MKKRIKRHRYVPAFGLININTRIVLMTTFILIIAGAVSFFLFENNNTLAGMSCQEKKLQLPFFGSVTPRTAGFNAVNMSLLSVPAIMMTIALMWIGASPVSTGGGIKTTTFAMAVLNLFKIIKGKERMRSFSVK